MNRPLPLIAGLLGVLFLAIAATYWLVPVGSLPSFFPGFKAGSAHIAGKHAIGSLIIALVLFTFACGRREPGAVRADYLVELRGLCAGRSARSNRCKSDAMKE
jgi:hypothetical protein